MVDGMVLGACVWGMQMVSEQRLGYLLYLGGRFVHYHGVYNDIYTHFSFSSPFLF